MKRSRDRFEHIYLTKVTWESCARPECGATNNLQILWCGAKDELGKRLEKMFDIRHLMYSLCLWSVCLRFAWVYGQAGVMRGVSGYKSLGSSSVQQQQPELQHAAFQNHDTKPWPPMLNTLQIHWLSFRPKWFEACSNGCESALHCFSSNYANWEWIVTSSIQTRSLSCSYLVIFKQHSTPERFNFAFETLCDIS